MQCSDSFRRHWFFKNHTITVPTDFDGALFLLQIHKNNAGFLFGGIVFFKTIQLQCQLISMVHCFSYKFKKTMPVSFSAALFFQKPYNYSAN